MADSYITDDIAAARAACRDATRIAILCGAGLSAASGVPTFRGVEGLWRRFRPEELASPDAFARDPLLVWQWYAERQRAIAACEPNAGHRAIAALLSEERTITVITQNVDGLQQRACTAAGVAAEADILELHGCLWHVRCTGCGAQRRLELALTIDDDNSLPRCAHCAALERPAVVWFGEMLDHELLQRAVAAAEASEVFLIAGTSGMVEPAASLARMSRGTVIEINPDATPLSAHADHVLRLPSEQALPAVLDTDS